MTLHCQLDSLQHKKKTGKNELFVSVVIPFHRGFDLLEKTVASLTQQSYPKDLFEVVIIADANHSDAKSIVDRYRNHISTNLVTLFNDKWGPATSRNAGIQFAKGDVIISLDCDMICPPTYLDLHMKWFHQSSKIATIGLRKYVNAGSLRSEDIIRDFQMVTSLPDICSISNTKLGARRDKRVLELENLDHHPFPGNCFHGGNVAYWRDDAIDIGLWDEDFNGNYGYEDIDFGQRLFENGVSLVFENGATTYHQESNFVSYSERQRGLSINRFKLYERFPELGRFRREVLAVQ